MESMVWWWHTIVVSQLCDSTIWNGMIELWRACYGECELWDSFNCVMAPYAMVQLYYGDESIVCLSYWQQGMVVVDHDSQLIVWWNNVIWFSWAMRRPSLCVWAMESMLWWWWTMVILPIVWWYNEQWRQEDGGNTPFHLLHCVIAYHHGKVSIVCRYNSSTMVLLNYGPSLDS
jgi:hypothetical protein